MFCIHHQCKLKLSKSDRIKSFRQEFLNHKNLFTKWKVSEAGWKIWDHKKCRQFSIVPFSPPDKIKTKSFYQQIFEFFRPKDFLNPKKMTWKNILGKVSFSALIIHWCKNMVLTRIKWTSVSLNMINNDRGWDLQEVHIFFVVVFLRAHVNQKFNE